jgi:hypothetical protein
MIETPKVYAHRSVHIGVHIDSKGRKTVVTRLVTPPERPAIEATKPKG